jgi:XTP/dITP diphosphohydrolase
MKITFATGNKGKLREAQEILGADFEIITPKDLGMTGDIEETGTSLMANSLIKAKYIYDNYGVNSLADDSGLEVEILGGAPGIYSARYAGPEHDFQANMDKLLDEMARMMKEASRAREYGINTVHATYRARFRTVVTFIMDGKINYFEGQLDGKIGLTKKGTNGFGYDPVFIPDMIPAEAAEPLPEGSAFSLEPDADGLVKNIGMITLAQLSEEQKNAISYRGKAMSKFASFLLGEKASENR